MHRNTTEKSGDYKEVRSLVRGLELLRALNDMPGGGASTSALARACGMDRTTAKRLLETLRHQDIVCLGTRDGFYRLSSRALELSAALQRVSWIAEVALPAMQNAVSRLKWPCDIATCESGQMVVRESTHRWSLIAPHPGVTGECLPIMRTALGRAHLAALSDDEIERLLDDMSRHASTRGAPAHASRDAAYRLVEETRARGYAVNDRTLTRHPEVVAVAVAVNGRTKPLAVVNLVYHSAVMTPPMLDGIFVPELQALADRIGQGYAAWHGESAARA